MDPLNKVIILASLFTLSCVDPSRINCTNTIARKQPMLPLTISIDPQFTQYEHDAIIHATEDWNRLFKMKLFIVDDSIVHNIILENDSFFPPLEQGLTRIYWKGPEITKWTIYLNLYWLRSTTMDAESLVVHELGHSLGLAHFDNSVMEPYLNLIQIRTTPGQTEKDALKCLYPVLN